MKWKKTIYLIMVLVLISFIFGCSSNSVKQECSCDVPELVISDNYLTSKHTIITSDLIQYSKEKIVLDVPDTKYIYSSVGKSMLPCINDRDRILLIEPDKLMVGDWIMFKKNSNYILHSIYSIERDELGIYYKTMGLFPYSYVDTHKVREEEVMYVVYGILK